MQEWYKEDLAYIHDVGFGAFALKSAPGILNILSRGRVRGGLVVDLGCGSGLWARELDRAGYSVFGVDISEAMIDIARARVPAAEFVVGSAFEVELPSCAAVTALGEVFNYLFDAKNSDSAMGRLFRRVYKALEPGGVFVFDVAEPGQAAAGETVRSFSEGNDWIVLVEKHEDARRRVLTRRIITLRETGGRYRRSDEVHRQRLLKAADVTKQLRGAGFRVRAARGYGAFDLPEAHVAFIARKPA